MQKRLDWVDILRGLAILLMIPANFAYYYIEPHPMWFRVFGSFAAPIFVMLSAGMVILSAKKHSFQYFLSRGALVMFAGVLLDMLLWHIVPIISFDVLYLIGFSIPLIYLLRACKPRQFFYLGIFICFLAAVLQQWFGYHENALVIPLAQPQYVSIPRILQSIFIDAWFPVFPWFGYACFGAGMFKIIFLSHDARLSRPLFLLFMLAALIGFILLFLPVDNINNLANDGILPSRHGYSEIFYPPTLAFALTLPGILACFTLLAQYLSETIFSKWLELFGKNSLLIYILHQVLGVLVVLPLMIYFDVEAIESRYLFALTVIVTILFLGLVCKVKQFRVRH